MGRVVSRVVSGPAIGLEVAHAVLAERERLMREIHDGVGAHLVGLLCLLGRPGADPVALQEHVKAALDDMRLVVDSLQPVEGDLVAVLAMLRWRLQPRLAAAGVQVRWDVSRLPPLPGLSPHAVLQVQRIVLEAVTNVLKHARAREVVFQARLVAGAIEITLVDDGCGFARSMSPGGQGLPNMRTRAATIGACVSVGPGERGGTRVRLVWPRESPALVEEALSWPP